MKLSIASAAFILAASVAWCASAHAGLVFYVNDAGGFSSSVAGRTALGTENFNEGNAAAAGPFNDPLRQFTISSPPFTYPAGILMPMTVQSNSLGGSATTVSPGGVLELPGYPFGPTPYGRINGLTHGVSGADQYVLANLFTDSLDWIFDSATAVSAVGLNPMSSTVGPLTVSVYSTTNTLLGSTSTPADLVLTNFLGITATGGDLIGRINFNSPVFAQEGGDNAALYQGFAVAAVPEPTVLALLGVALGALSFSRRRKTR